MKKITSEDVTVFMVILIVLGLILMAVSADNAGEVTWETTSIGGFIGIGMVNLAIILKLLVAFIYRNK